MPDNSPRGARLDHVSEAGDLVFEAGGERFVVTVDDALERAMLAARQIRSEAMRGRQPNTVSTLPISSIQQLIRAGADPAQVAQRYGLDEALVRRFSASVLTERQYAIEQFKRVPAPKESRLRTVEEIIDMTLLAARVDRGTLVWSSSRRGHEPWHIVAKFMSAGRKVHAEWTWDMHDNTVMCLNAAARKLLGEQSLGVGPETGASAAAAGVRPVNGPRDAASRTAVLDARESFPIDLGPSTGDGTGAEAPGVKDAPSSSGTPDGRTAVPETPSAVAATSGGSGSEVATATTLDAAAFATTTDDLPVLHAQSAAEAALPASGAGNGEAPVTVSARRDDAASGDKPGQSGADESDTGVTADGRPRTEKAEAARRRSGRSAVPSWDEILFGE